MEAGHLALLDYGERPRCWHTRLLLAPVSGSTWIILTPDLDQHPEELSLQNSDLDDFEYLGASAVPPARIPLNQIYGFGAMDPADLANYMRQGRLMADAHRQAQGLPPLAAVAAPAAVPGQVPGAAPVAAAGGPAAGGGAAPGGFCWVCLEDSGGRSRGDVVVHEPGVLPVGHVVLGDKALIPHISGAGESCLVKRVAVQDAAALKLSDLRVLPVHFDAQGLRRREFSQAVGIMVDGVPQGGGLQLEGPTTGLNILKAMRDQSMTPTSYHEYWIRTADIPKGDRSVYEHECLSRILESMVTVDQLNICALQGAELVCRRMQVIREAHRVSPSSPDYSAADYYMGWKYRRGAHGVDSGLSSYVAGEMRSDAAVMKEARKAREEAQARRQNQNKKGSGGEQK